MLPVGEVNDRRDTTVALRVGGKPGDAGSTAGWSDAGWPDDDAVPAGRVPTPGPAPDVPPSSPPHPATRSITAATTSPVRPTSAPYDGAAPGAGTAPISNVDLTFDDDDRLDQSATKGGLQPKVWRFTTR
jgi:hypothetical protein